MKRIVIALVCHRAWATRRRVIPLRGLAECQRAPVKTRRNSNCGEAASRLFKPAPKALTLLEGYGPSVRCPTFELSRHRQRGALDSKRKMGRRPSA